MNQAKSSLYSKGNRHFLIGLARAAAGAIIFALPLFMTMEMWNFGFYLDPIKRGVMIVMSIPLLVGLSHIIGFEDTFGWQDDLIDTFVALFVGFICSTFVLALLGVIESDMTLEEVLGKIAIQIIPGSIGALLAQSQLGNAHSQKKKESTSYFGELFLMSVGALFLSLSIAPTEEIILLAYGLGKIQVLIIALVSLTLMHLFVYSVDFKGSESSEAMIPPWKVFFRFSFAGYGIVLLTSLFVLWVFGPTTGISQGEVLSMTVVLGFPSAIGAAAARLII